MKTLDLIKIADYDNDINYSRAVCDRVDLSFYFSK